jgi:colanic acid biosynthesis glycosyl transferase WcaI
MKPGTRRPRVLVLSQYYRPEPNFITADVAEALSREADVTVLAGQPNYPTGEIYPGYEGTLPTRSVENGVTVWRLPHVVDRSTSRGRRALSYLSFVAGAALYAPVLARGAELIWVYHTPFTTALAALPARFLTRTRLVYTSADLWPESLRATDLVEEGPVLRALFAYSRWVVRRADEVICSTRGTLERYAADGYPRERLHYIPVWTDGVSKGPPPSSDRALARAVVYTGNLGPAQGLDTAVRAAARLREEGCNVRFLFYGTGSEEGELRRLIADLGADNVELRGRVSPEEAFRASASALGQLVSLRRTPLFRMTLPSKLPTAMAAGSPILAGLDGEAREVALDSGGAFAFTSGDPESLCAEVRQLLALSEEQRSALRVRLRAYYQRHFVREVLLERYRSVLLGTPGVAEPGAYAAATLPSFSSGPEVRR